jgi:hypothetical protein
MIMAARSVPDGQGTLFPAPDDPAGRLPEAGLERGPQPRCHREDGPAVIPAALLPAAVLTDLLIRIVDAADDLAARGYLDGPDDDPDGAWMIPAETAAELAALAAGCWECRRGPSALAQHWLNREQVRYILSQPDWKCPCGAVYKAHGEPASGQEFYTVIDDGTGYDWAGSYRVNSKRKVTHSDKCPACGRPFAGPAAPRETVKGARVQQATLW